MFDSPDLESILNEQFSRLWNKEEDVSEKIRCSKHTSKHLSSFLDKKKEIELKYNKDMMNLCNNYINKIDETKTMTNVWNEYLNNELSQILHRKKYIEQIENQQKIFNKLYHDEKTKENELSKQIEDNKKQIQISQKKMDKVKFKIYIVRNTDI